MSEESTDSAPEITPTSGVDIDAFLADMQEQSSEPSENREIPTEAAAEPAPVSQINTPAPAPSHTGDTDIDGTVFDPNTHALTRDGEPSITSGGRFRRKKGQGRSSVVNPTVAANKAAADAATVEEQQMKARMAGVALSEIWFKCWKMTLGPDWEPIKQDDIDERAEMHYAATAYCVENEIVDIPPGILLSAVMLGYTLPRFGQEETQKRVSRITSVTKRGWSGIKSWWSKRRATRTDSRDNRKRQDTPSETTVQQDKGDGSGDDGTRPAP